MKGFMQKKTRCFVLCCMGLLMLAAALGCGDSSLSPVKGVVKVDGKPAKGVSLTFVKVGASVNDMPANAVSGDDGSFSLRTGEVAGAAPGKYKVAALYPDPSVKFTIQQQMQGATPEDAPDLLKGKYTLRNTNLEVEIKGGDQSIQIDLAP
jgi:hypothetical protein